MWGDAAGAGMGAEVNARDARFSERSAAPRQSGCPRPSWWCGACAWWASGAPRSFKRLLTLPQQLQARQQGNIWWGSGGREQPHAGASTEELRDGLVAVALDKVLLLHVGMELAKH